MDIAKVLEIPTPNLITPSRYKHSLKLGFYHPHICLHFTTPTETTHPLCIFKDQPSGILLKLTFSFINTGSFTLTGYRI